MTRIGRGSYATPAVAAAAEIEREWARWKEPATPEEIAGLARARAVAMSQRGVLSHRSAAAQYRWPVFVRPDRLEIGVPPGRESCPDVSLYRRHRRIPAHDRDGYVTAPMRTVVDCARDLPWPEALAVADSALRSKSIGRSNLENATDLLRGPGSARARRVAAAADGDSANPFESAMRAHALTVPGFDPVTQYTISDQGFFARVDVADPRLRIVLEAESFAYHGSSERFTSDVARYTGLTERDWLVLRFTLADVRRGTPVTIALEAAVHLRSKVAI